jgi:hypothetical protein
LSTKSIRWRRVGAVAPLHVLHDLVQPVHLALAVADLALAVARQIPERPDRVRRYQTRSQQARLQQLAEPLGILDVCLAARDLLDMARVDQQAIERSSSIAQTGFQYTPVASIAARSTRCASSQSRSASSPRTVL